MAKPRKKGAKTKLKEFFLANKEKVLTPEQLSEVAGVSSWQRRLREIRDEEGWPIQTNTDLKSIPIGHYILVDDPPKNYVFEPPISQRLRAQVLERNGYTCTMCGAAAGDVDENNPNRTVRLHIGHIQDRDHRGETQLHNLRALCSACNQGAKNIAQEPPSYTFVIAQVRRAKESDQRKVLDWLNKKFATQKKRLEDS